MLPDSASWHTFRPMLLGRHGNFAMPHLRRLLFRMRIQLSSLPTLLILTIAHSGSPMPPVIAHNTSFWQMEVFSKPQVVVCPDHPLSLAEFSNLSVSIAGQWIRETYTTIAYTS
jgi:hypothetical protein